VWHTFCEKSDGKLREVKVCGWLCLANVSALSVSLLTDTASIWCVKQLLQLSQIFSFRRPSPVGALDRFKRSQRWGTPAHTERTKNDQAQQLRWRMTKTGRSISMMQTSSQTCTARESPASDVVHRSLSLTLPS